jgi:hypothetical protein
MRSLLSEVLADFRSRVLAPPPVADVLAKSETIADVVAAAPTPTVDEVVENLQTAAPVVNVVATEAAAIKTVESVVEHVDQLVRPARPLVDMVATEAAPPIEISDSIVEHVDEPMRPTSNPLIDDSVEELPEPETVASADVFSVGAAPTKSEAIVEEYEEFFQTESPPPIDTVDLQVAPPETAAPIVDEYVFRPTEPLPPIIDEYVEELRWPEAPPPTETIELSAASSEPIEANIDEFIEELRRPESPSWIETVDLGQTPAEPIIDEPEVTPIETIEMDAPQAGTIEPIVDDYVVPVSDVANTPPAAPPPPDARIDALWDAASSATTEAETAPLTPVESASPFMAPELIAEARSLEIPEAPPAPEELAPEPPIEFAPEPPIEFAPEPPAIVETEAAPRSESFVTEPEPAPTSAVVFPELRVADDRGLHQIQIVISPIHSFPRLLETERRMRALSTVNALRLRDFRNGVATFVVAVSEAISPAEFGAVIQMLESLHLRLEGTTQSTVELHAEDEPATD